MTGAAFLRKDLRISARAGAILPGIPTLLFGQAIAFAAIGAWVLSSGVAPSPSVWSGAVTSLASIAFFLAVIGPTSAGTVGAMQESVPEIAESLASAPIDPVSFFLGKASLPILQGLAIQLAFLPSWGFLVGVGVTTPGAALRATLASCLLVPVAALVGATRFSSGLSPRRARALSGFRRAAQQGASTQIWVLMAAIFWTTQTVRAVGGASVPGASIFARAVDALRPVAPMLLLDGAARTPLFSAHVPPILLTPILLAVLVVSRLGVAVAGSSRAEERDRRWARNAALAARSVLATYLVAALWPLAPGLAVAIGASFLLLVALAGFPGATRRDEVRNGALPCALPALATLGAAGPAGFAFWIPTAALAGALGAALPPRRGDERRGIAVFAVVAAGLGVVLAAVILSALAPMVGDDAASLFGWLSALSPFVAPFSLARDLLGPMPGWDSLALTVPALHASRPWLVAPVFFGAIAAIAIWRGAARKR